MKSVVKSLWLFLCLERCALVHMKTRSGSGWNRLWVSTLSRDASSSLLGEMCIRQFFFLSFFFLKGIKMGQPESQLRLLVLYFFFLLFFLSTSSSKVRWLKCRLLVSTFGKQSGCWKMDGVWAPQHSSDRPSLPPPLLARLRSSCQQVFSLFWCLSLTSIREQVFSRWSIGVTQEMIPSKTFPLVYYIFRKENIKDTFSFFHISVI